jgi:arylsulfatase A-like enzyme/Tfp pilus assembly protein PilF
VTCLGRAGIFAVLATLAAACGGSGPASGGTPAATGGRPNILLLTLDTTRADVLGPDAVGVSTPAFNAIAARGQRFRQAYATVPETLPSHSSMMTGLYPAGHGVHENGRYLSDQHPVLAALLKAAGYRTDAFVSTFVLARQFGLSRGFDSYHDDFSGGRAERPASETTDAVIAALGEPAPSQPRFLWVHFNDPHAPYVPPEPYLGRYPGRPYFGEVAAMDEQIGRLVQAFEARVPEPRAILVVADHGEGLGEHGERLHGNLLYQATMRVPLLLVGPGVPPGTNDTPVSTRRVFHTILDWAGLDAAHSLRAADPEVVLGEAMKPFLEYGWQPQVMGIADHVKVIRTSSLEAYDLAADPDERRDLHGAAAVSGAIRTAVGDYPVPGPHAAGPRDALREEARKKLASLGYVGSTVAPDIRKDAPRPVDMAGLFDALERASAFFVTEKYVEVIPLLQKILAADPRNLDATLRLATAHSALGHAADAVALFRKAAELAPQSTDVTLYTALHYAHGPEWERAVPDLERIVADMPERLPAVEGLALVRERQGRTDEAIRLRQQVYRLREPTPDDLVKLGALAMQAQQTPLAIESFEQARHAQGPAFAHDLELGVLYLAARRFLEARDALDRVPAGHPDSPMVLFKRAQVSVLLHEPDAARRIDLARQKADATTRPLIASEKLFQSIR